MSKRKKTAGVSVGLGGLTFIIFLFLKLAGIGQVATWSWWWIISPLWIPWALIFGFMAIFAIVVAIIVAIKHVG